MSISVTPVFVESKEDLKNKLQDILKIQELESIVVIKGIKLTEDEQLQLVRDMGDITGWFPNNSEDFNHKYVETHSYSKDKQDVGNDQIILSWHLEHVDYDEYIPLVAGVWNMRVFNCDPESGKTYFIDSKKIYNEIYTEEEKDFLRKCKAKWIEIKPDGRNITNYVDIVQPHWKTKEEQIRVELHYFNATSLHLFQGFEPNKDQIDTFHNLINRFEAEVRQNENLRIVHKWEEGDILVPDLFSLAHAVTGGFKSEDREFTGYWCYLSSPEKTEKEKIQPSWRGE